MIASADRGQPILQKKPSPLREIILFGDDATDGARSFNELIRASMVDDALSQGVSVDDVVDSQPGDMATIAYTSGTTGYPKGAMQSQRAVVLNAAMFGKMQVRTAPQSLMACRRCTCTC